MKNSTQNSMKKNKVFAVFGYNNTRIYDLFKMKDIFRNKFDAALLLVKEGITAQDREVAPYYIDCRLETSDIIAPVADYIKTHNLELIGCLPFSDKGVIGSAHVSKYFGLVGDDVETSYPMLDKNLFRQLEAKIPLEEFSYKKPFFIKTKSKDELFAILSERGQFFIKPTSEGNSRGCMKILTSEDLKVWLSENSQALDSGVICEEILSDDEEYSYDGVAGKYWITKKYTTSGAYRAEYQHIVPAPLSQEKSKKIHRILKPLLKELGSNGGAFHHEFFILKDSRIASVEPNRRPAGMWIWDLASWVFEDFDPWDAWVNHCAGATEEFTEAMEVKEFAGVRAVIAPRSGVIAHLDQDKTISQMHTIFGSDVRLSFLKKPGSIVSSLPRDNSDFLAFIALKHKDPEVLVKNLALAEQVFISNLRVESCA